MIVRKCFTTISLLYAEHNSTNLLNLSLSLIQISRYSLFTFRKETKKIFLLEWKFYYLRRSSVYLDWIRNFYSISGNQKPTWILRHSSSLSVYNNTDKQSAKEKHIRKKTWFQTDIYSWQEIHSKKKHSLSRNMEQKVASIRRRFKE